MLKTITKIILLSVILFGAKNITIAQSDVLKTTINLQLSNDDLITAFNKIQETLSGNLSTVRRIENKWKTGFRNAHKYLNKMHIIINHFYGL